MTKENLGRWIVKNPAWRLLSIVLAFIIWMNVATEPEMSSLISVPVQFRDPPAGIEVTARASEMVQLEARGSSGQLRDLANQKPVVTFDFSGVREPGDRTFTITRAETNLPRTVELLRAQPAQIRFHFERSEHRLVPVTVHFEGRLPNGLQLLSYTANPPTEEIVGPESQVRKVAAALTDAIDLSTLDPARLTKKVSLYLPDAQVRFVSQPYVTVTIVAK